MEKKIYLSPPHLTEAAFDLLKDAVESNWIAPVGPHIDAFEAELKSAVGTRYLLATNSATSAIHLGLIALGVCKDDEVICSNLTFCASVNPVIYCQGKPVFVDAEEDSWNMDPALLEAAIIDRIKKVGKGPKAIVLVHLYGMPARIDEIMEISRRYEIPVLEDAAEAFGAQYKGRQAGTSGVAGVLSFNGNKIITTSSGGALFSSDRTIVETARFYAQEAREPLPYYEHRAVGYNYRMSNLLAAVGRSQLAVLEARVEKRRENFNFYRNAFSDLPHIQFQSELEGARSNRWLTVILLDRSHLSPEVLRTALLAKNIETRQVWKPMHLQPVFTGFPVYTNGVSERIFNTGLCLPSGSNMTCDDLEKVSEMIKELVE